jgi:hypothetical protein
LLFDTELKGGELFWISIKNPFDSFSHHFVISFFFFANTGSGADASVVISDVSNIQVPDVNMVRIFFPMSQIDFDIFCHRRILILIFCRAYTSKALF